MRSYISIGLGIESEIKRNTASVGGRNSAGLLSLFPSVTRGS